MSEKNNYFLEDLLSQTENLLNELEYLENHEGTDHYIEDEISDKAHEVFVENEYEGQEYKSDGTVEINISVDEMNVVADFYPPTEGMKPVVYENVAMAFAAKNVVFGIEADVIKESILTCNTEFKILKNIIIARGKTPVKHIPKHFVLSDELILTGKKNTEGLTRIDYKEMSPFKLVKKGQVLAQIIPEQQGEHGYTVFGKEIKFSTKNITVLVPGKNTAISGNKVMSECDGTFEQDSKGFYVNEVLQISSNVDYSTGNVEFPGDIIIKGQIQDGFKIKAGGSLYTAGTLDASVINCENDLYVGMGIIGRKKGRVKAGGKIKAKFIENCFVESHGLIILEAGIMNSEIFTSDKITLGKKGVIVGGCIYAQNGLIATQIGSSMGPRTEIYCGVDYVIENKLKWLRDNAIQVATKLNQVREQISKSGEQNPKLIELRDRLQSTLRQLNNNSSNLVYKLDKNDNAEVVVRNTVYPGVYIEICHISYVVNRELGSVRFKLDKKNGVIRMEPL